jgi:CRISPR-associated protein Csh1
MLRAIKELGQYIRENKDLDDIQVLTEISKLANTKKMICIVFRKRDDNDLFFDSVYIETFGRDKNSKILYRPFRHGRYNAFLTSVITTRKTDEEAIKNTIKKWELWFKQYCEKFGSNYPLIEILKCKIEKNEKEIFSKVIEKYSYLNKDEKRNCLLTIKVRDGISEKYPAEIPEFVEIFKNTSSEDLYSKHGVIAKGSGICAFCGKESEVMPASPFAIFTVDKVGFAYEFDRQNSWKQLPICFGCYLDLEAGKNFLEKQLSFTLYGYRYFVIPSFVFRGVSDEIISEIELSRKNDDYRDGLLNAEEDILEIIKEREDVLNLIFVFCKPKQQFFDIIRYVEEVPPSWIKKIYDIFYNINQKSIFKERELKIILGEKWSGEFREGKGMWDGKTVSKLNLAGMIGEFFYHREKDRKIFDKSSLNILGDILESKHIDREYFIRHLIYAIREEYRRNNEWNERLLSLKSLYLFNFLLELNLIHLSHFGVERFKEVKLMENPMEKYVNIEKFFSEFSNAFDSSDKKAAFLEGVLTNFLLGLQYAQRGTTPFRKKLHGLKLDKRKIKKLLPEIIEKLRAYDAAYPEIEELISKYFIEADENGWTVSDDEISYYFALGLNLGKIFRGGDKK